MATSNNELIRVEHVVKEFDGGAVKALNDCNLSINRGEVVAIIGPSGSGKSTLLRCLNLLEVPTSGSVWFNGVDITDMTRDELRSKIGMVLQDTWLFGGTIRDNIAYGRPDASEEEIMAAATAWSPKTPPQPENGRFEVRIREACS